MTEYIEHIKFYNSNYWFSTSSMLVPSNEWGNKKDAEEYMQKYWLQEEEYCKLWQPIQNKIFTNGNGLPNLIYPTNFNMLALRGGCLFLEEDFKQLQEVMQSIGEEYFVVIQRSNEFMDGEPMFRMKFPVNITWQELTSGNYISAVILEMPYNEYYVFGTSEKWGKYAANDYDYPLDIIGFDSELTSPFSKIFKQSNEEIEEIREWIPSNYKDLIRW